MNKRLEDKAIEDQANTDDEDVYYDEEDVDDIEENVKPSGSQSVAAKSLKPNIVPNAIYNFKCINDSDQAANSDNIVKTSTYAYGEYYCCCCDASTSCCGCYGVEGCCYPCVILRGSPNHVSLLFDCFATLAMSISVGLELSMLSFMKFSSKTLLYIGVSFLIFGCICVATMFMLGRLYTKDCNKKFVLFIEHLFGFLSVISFYIHFFFTVPNTYTFDFLNENRFFFPQTQNYACYLFSIIPFIIFHFVMSFAVYFFREKENRKKTKIGGLISLGCAVASFVITIIILMYIFVKTKAFGILRNHYKLLDFLAISMTICISLICIYIVRWRWMNAKGYDVAFFYVAFNIITSFVFIPITWILGSGIYLVLLLSLIICKCCSRKKSTKK